MSALSLTKLTFQDDALQRGPFAKRLERYLIVESDFVEGSVVAALNAPFGSGKSTFIEMWKNDLLERRQSPNGDAFEAPMPIILNAWESDFCGDPLVAILSGLLNAVDHWQGSTQLSEKKVNDFKEVTKDVGWLLAGIGNGFVSKITGVSTLEVLELKDAKKKERNPEKPDFIKLFDQRQEALRKLRSALEKTFAGETPKVIIFVDELDRCRPDYAIHYLETIKHVFNVKGMIFLLAVDAGQLEVSAKALFGNDLNFPEYFRKFCHRSFDLHEPQKALMESFMRDQVTKYVAVLKKRKSIIQETIEFTVDAVQVAQAFNLKPRQIQEQFRILGYLFAANQSTHHPYTREMARSALLLTAYKITTPTVYQDMGEMSTDHSKICKDLSSRGLGTEEFIGFYLAESYIKGPQPNYSLVIKKSNLADQPFIASLLRSLNSIGPESGSGAMSNIKRHIENINHLSR